MQHDERALPERGFLEYLLILSARKRFIILTVLIVTVMAAGASFLLPKTYRATATIMPPKNTGGVNLLSSSSSALMRQFSPLRALSGGLSPDLYGYVSILKSRTLLEAVVRRFNLKQRYGVTMMMKAVQALKDNSDYTVNEETTITVGAEDSDPRMARDIVAYVLVKLDSMQRDLTVREARENRVFIERRLQRNRDDMRAAEIAMKDFQEKHGVVAIPSETSASVSAYAEVYAQKMMKEFEVSYLERVLGRDNPQLAASRLELSELSRQLSAVPVQGMEFLRLYREFAVQQKMFEVLLPLCEQARIEEQRNMPTLLVIDPPELPERHSSPKRMIITLVFFVLALLFGIAAVVVSTRIEDMRLARPEQHARLMALLGPLARLRRRQT
jgi:uncharacterized protein involved in exopolysaccharide biosynthesis